MLSWILLRATEWAKAHQFYTLEFEKLGFSIWAFIRTWDGDPFCRVAMAVLQGFESDATLQMSVVGLKVAAIGDSASAVAISWRVSHSC